MNRRSYLKSTAVGLGLGILLQNKTNTKTLPESYNKESHSMNINSDTITVKTDHFPSRKKQKFNFSIEKYNEEARKTLNYHNQITREDDEKWINRLVDSFLPEYQYNDVWNMSRFTQNIEYSLDKESTSQFEYNRHPVETIVDGVGNCVDKSVLLYRILKTMGYNVGYVMVPRHILLMIPRRQTYRSKLLQNKITPVIQESNDFEYVFLEATYKKDPGIAGYTKDDIVYTYTEESGFSIGNLEAIPDHSKEVLEYIKDSYS